MSCPVCGGSTRTELAPGFFRCTSSVFSQARDAVDDRMIRVLENICGYEYQEASENSSMQSCKCGTFAIGRCKQCGLAVCVVTRDCVKQMDLAFASAETVL
jgi:hypothetical protein